jgi:hypothetical protein
MLESKKLLPSGMLRETAVDPDGKLYVKTSNPHRDAQMEAIQQRRNEGVIKQKADMHFALDIPEFDYAMLVKRQPELSCGDPDTEHKAWQRFLNSSESKPYRTT